MWLIGLICTILFALASIVLMIYAVARDRIKAMAVSVLAFGAFVCAAFTTVIFAIVGV